MLKINLQMQALVVHLNTKVNQAQGQVAAANQIARQAQAGPPGGEVPWVSELLSEFSEVFQDPLPPGLPPERSEGHNICDVGRDSLLVC
jgi:hypothetical protein